MLDVACGTGHHAAMFHSWALRVEAADISPRMIKRARSNFGEPTGLRWVVRGFDEPTQAVEPFDLVLCVGNSLALATDLATVERAIERNTARGPPGGAVVIQTLNLWRLPDGPCTWRELPASGVLPQGQSLVVKGVHRCGDRGYVELIVTVCSGDVAMRTESVAFLGLQAAELKQVLRRNSVAQVTVFGGYQEQPYEPSKSVDLLIVARK